MNAVTEFSLIEKYFKAQQSIRPEVILGIGDDAALVRITEKSCLALSVDTLVQGVHFPAQTKPGDLGYKALAVNLSDLAAMGAEPAWMTLALTLPQADPAWLEPFSQGLFSLADLYGVQLIGGDTTRGPLSITIQVQGWVPEDLALRRDGARPGDKIYVSGTLGDAGLGLRVHQGEIALPQQESDWVLTRFYRPQARVQLGLLLRGVASAAIDISDGLMADLGHILERSQVGAEIEASTLPLSTALKTLPTTEAQALALGAGDDYELCFTVPADHEQAFKRRMEGKQIPYTAIGEIQQELGLRVGGFKGSLAQTGYRHF